MATFPNSFDSAASAGAYVLASSSTASSARTVLSEVISDSAIEFDLPQKIVMSQRDFKLFLVALDSDAEPNEALRAAAETFKEKYR